MPDSLHLVQMFFDGRRLLRAVEHHDLPVGAADDPGYLVHAELAACFGSLAPKPFRVREHGWRIEVLGYAESGADDLRKQAETYAEPVYWSACSRLESKVMPDDWESGRRVGFEVRVCPVVRLASAMEIPARGNDGKTATIRAGSEVDAFLRKCWQRGEDESVDRAVVYGRWLAETLGESAELERTTMTRFQLASLARRTQGGRRRMKRIQRPDATLRGEVVVKNPNAFRELLARGIGRHRAFGFGMLLLRPPG